MKGLKVVKVRCPLVKQAFQDEKGEIVAWEIDKEACLKFLKAKEQSQKKEAKG
jgi:nitrite reductase/ring-hydroxylating ferredoxin subunit